tara:strand:- start:158 stop:382 length:225 start_codon:yes stop_codon:yes gene_type:complete
MKRLLFASLLLTLLVGCSSKDKTYIQKKNDCARTMAINISEINQQFLKKYDLDIYNDYLTEDEVIKEFCYFYTK